MTEIGNSVPFALYNTNTGLVNLVGDTIRTRTLVTNELLAVETEIEVETLAIDGELKLFEPTLNFFNSLKANPALASNITWCLPTADGGASTALITDGAGNLSFSPIAVGNISGGIFSNDNALVRIDTISGNRNIQESNVLLDDTDNMSGLTSMIISPTTAHAMSINPFGAAAGNTGELRFLELAANGTDYTALKAPDSIGGARIFTLPAAFPDDVEHTMISSNTGVLSFYGYAVRAGSGTTNPTDNTLPRWDNPLSNNSREFQQTGITVDNSDNITGANSLTVGDVAVATSNINLNNSTRVRFQGVTSGNYTSIRANDNGSTFEYQLPINPAGAVDDILIQSNIITGELEWKSASTLNMVQATSAFGTDQRLIRSDGVGRLVDRTNIQADDFDSLSGINGINANGSAQISLSTSLGSATAIVLTASGVGGGLDINATAAVDIDANSIELNGITVNSTNDVSGVNSLSFLEVGAGSDEVKLTAQAASDAYTIELPDNVGAAGNILQSAVSGSVSTLSWIEAEYPPGYVDGMKQSYVSATTVSFTAGNVRSSDNTENISVGITTNVVISTSGLNGLSATHTESSDQSYDIYAIFDSTDVKTTGYLMIEEGTDISTVSEFLSDYDKSKLVGWIRNDDSSNIMKHVTMGNGRQRKYYYDVPKSGVGSTQVLANGGATTWTNVDCSDFMQPNSEMVVLRCAVGDPVGTFPDNAALELRMDGSTIGDDLSLYTVSPGEAMGSGAFHDAQIEMPTATTRIIEYQIDNGNGSEDAFIQIAGFIYSI